MMSQLMWKLQNWSIKNQATTDELDFIVESTTQDANYDLRAYHLAGNCIGAVVKITRNSGAGDIHVESGLCKLETVNTIFGSAGDYYESMRAHKLLLL